MLSQEIIAPHSQNLHPNFTDIAFIFLKCSVWWTDRGLIIAPNFPNLHPIFLRLHPIFLDLHPIFLKLAPNFPQNCTQFCTEFCAGFLYRCTQFCTDFLNEFCTEFCCCVFTVNYNGLGDFMVDPKV